MTVMIGELAFHLIIDFASSDIWQKTGRSRGYCWQGTVGEIPKTRLKKGDSRDVGLFIEDSLSMLTLAPLCNPRRRNPHNPQFTETHRTSTASSVNKRPRSVHC
ncbi:hypothetical protein LSTR_LSTR001536 [Laodelphax striatellus]|uniref:Uncharacterized protein n=1 Tax=Laodelphax striatellus TaxID=195883 RepID=A0A482XBC4_LAOST|nr:hypothetical protein LSTR_LSTR001536 [Laodelphax striatellus]